MKFLCEICNHVVAPKGNVAQCSYCGSVYRKRSSNPSPEEVVIGIEVYGYYGVYSLDVRPDKTRVVVGEKVRFACLVTADGIPVQGASIEIYHTPPGEVEHYETTLTSGPDGTAFWPWTAEMPLGTHSFRFVLVAPPIIIPYPYPTVIIL